MLKLHNLTLVMIETREHELAALAVEDCLKVAEFGDVLILTDRSTAFPRIGTRIEEVPDWSDKLGWARSMWYDVPPLF